MEDKEILKKYPIIENKNTDATTIKKKSEAWNAVMHDYNAVRTEIRTVTQLKRCWDKIKRQKKMELSKERQNRMSTGGGGGIPDINILPDVEVIATHLSEEVTNLVDSDAQYMGNKLRSRSRSPVFRNNPVANCDMVTVKGNLQYDP
uniref:Regulatory protein zeste n=1 Tax=Diabrotica virgifera virgifera TaxID=50390 RepID=A0A6P7GQY3_DIAVI